MEKLRFKRIVGFSALFSLSMLFFFSCTFGLEPLSASRKASVSVTLSGTADSGSDSGSRAIATDSGYVYLQTGITAETATLYGPYPVASGSTATITDILAGTYPALILFFLPELPTAPITAIHTADATVESVRVAAQKAFVTNVALCSSSSIGLVSDYTIKEGEQNPITASLVPITALKPNEDNSVAVSGNAGKRASRFIRLEGIKEKFDGTNPTSKKELIMAVVNPSLVGSLEVTGIGLYDSTGALVSRDNGSVTIAVGEFKTKAVSWSGDDVYYAFVEFTGPEVQCVFSASVGVPTNLVNLYLDLNIPSNPQIVPMPVPAGTVIPLPTFPASYPGYTLLGWATTSTATTPVYNNGFGYTVGTSDVTLYAVWGVIQLDTIAPSASSFWIYDLDSVSNQYTNSQSVRLMLTYDESASGASGVSKVTLTGFEPLSGTSISFNGTNQTIDSLASDTITLAVPMIGSGTIIIDGITLPSGDEAKLATVTLIDAAGNASMTIDASTTLDTTAPTSLTLTPTSTAYPDSGTSVPMNYYISGMNISYSPTADEFGSGLKGFNTTGLTTITTVPGNTIVLNSGGLTTVYAVDNAGNVSAGLEINVVADLSPPTNLFMNPTSSAFPASGTSVSTTYYTQYSSISFTPAANDASSGVQGFNTDGSTAIMTVPGGTMLLASGTTTTIFAVDNAGNVTSTGIGITIIQDTSAPTLVTTPTSTYTDLSFQATDTGGSGVYSYSISQTAAIQSTPDNVPSMLTYVSLSSSVLFSGSATVTGLTNLTSIGYHYVKLIMYDVAGNFSTYYIERFNSGSATPTCTIK
jgi:hypothetical protein